MKSILNSLVCSLLIVLCFLPASAAGEGKISGFQIDNVGMGGNMFRLDGNKYLFLDDLGMHLEGYANVSLPPVSNKRVFCMIMPILDGQPLSDDKGICLHIVAFNSSDGKVKIEIPYFWIASGQKEVDMTKKINLKIYESIDKAPLVETTVSLAEMNVKINREGLGEKMIGDMMGGSSGIGESILEGMFGSGDKIESTCAACEGEGICPYCDGDGFWTPASCRKCSRNPGICRRCKGTGYEEHEVQINSGGGLFGY